MMHVTLTPLRQSIESHWTSATQRGIRTGAEWVARLNFLSPMDRFLRVRVVVFLNPYLQRDEISKAELIRVTYNVDYVFQKLGCRLLHLAISQADQDLVQKLTQCATLNFPGENPSKSYLQHALLTPDLSMEDRSSILVTLMDAKANPDLHHPLKAIFETPNSFTDEEKAEFAFRLIRLGVNLRGGRLLTEMIQEGCYATALLCAHSGADCNNPTEEETGVKYPLDYLLESERPLPAKGLELLQFFLVYGVTSNRGPLQLAFTHRRFEATPIILETIRNPWRNEEQKRRTLENFPKILEATFHLKWREGILESNQRCLNQFTRATGKTAEDFSALSFEEKREYLRPFVPLLDEIRSSSVLSKLFTLLQSSEQLESLNRNVETVPLEYRDAILLTITTLILERMLTDALAISETS